MLKRHHQRAIAYTTTCITILIIFWKLSSPDNSDRIRKDPPKSAAVEVSETKSEHSFDSGIDLPSIRSLFKRADTTADGYLSKKELAWSISSQVQKHLQNALRGNFRQFFAIDKIKPNGQVEWDEWLAYFKRTEPAKVGQ